MNFKTVSFGLLMSLLMLNGGKSNECTYYQIMETGITYYAYNSNYPDKTRDETHCIWKLESSDTIKINCSIDIPSLNNCIEDSISIQFDGSESQKYCGKGEIIGKGKSGKNVNIKFDAQHESKFLCQITTISSDNSQHCSCGWKNPTKIVGGNETGVNEYPMMAGLVNFDTRELYCGATIIHNEYVLTAAHCVYKTNITKTGVVVGEHDVTTGRETNATKLYRIEWCKIHFDYNPNTDTNDIAVCKIVGSIKYSNKVGPACLPFQHRDDSFYGADVIELGWGLLEFGGAKAERLQKVHVNVITTSDCKPYYETSLYCKMCTYTPNKDSCQMDSGGPVLWKDCTTDRNVLVGIISAGFGCASEKPSLNTRVGCYVDWIKRVTGVDFCEVE